MVSRQDGRDFLKNALFGYSVTLVMRIFPLHGDVFDINFKMFGGGHSSIHFTIIRCGAIRENPVCGVAGVCAVNLVESDGIPIVSRSKMR